LQHKSGYIVWLIILTALVVLFLAWQYLGYCATIRTLPTEVTMAGISVGNMTREQALSYLEVAFATPLSVRYQDRNLTLSPHAVDLRYDANQTAVNLDAALAESRGLEGFLAYALRRPAALRDVPVAVGYSEEQLAHFLNRVADEYDRPPEEPVELPLALDFRPPRPGSVLNVQASQGRLSSALVSADREPVDLVVEIQEAPHKDLELLKGLLQSRLDDHSGLIPGIFVKDLQTGDELAINGDVAYAGLSVLKIAVLEETYRSLDGPPGVETKKLISETMTESGNFTANLLLRDVIDEGDAYRAVETLTASMKQLGLENTYMAAPYDKKIAGLSVVTSTNSRTDISTDADPFIQTTPLDVGLLLEKRVRI